MPPGRDEVAARLSALTPAALAALDPATRGAVWDLADPEVTKTWFRFIDQGIRLAPELTVPLHDDWTCFAVIAFAPETYTSPWLTERLLEETGSYRWYDRRQDDPTADAQLFATEVGDEAEMWNLKDRARP